MTHFQRLFVQNLRFLRNKKGLSQVKFSESLAISPNYLNAVENGKNFPSPEIIQQISDILEILPYQLFLEHPAEISPLNTMVSELLAIKQRLIKEIDILIEKYEKSMWRKNPINMVNLKLGNNGVRQCFSTALWVV